MYYALSALGGFLLATIIWGIRYTNRNLETWLELGRTFGIKCSPDWDVFKQRRFIIKVLVVQGVNSHMDGSCAKVQAGVLSEWRKLE